MESMFVYETETRLSFSKPRPLRCVKTLVSDWAWLVALSGLMYVCVVLHLQPNLHLA